MDKSEQTAQVYSKIANIYTKTFNKRSYCLNHFVDYLKAGSSILDVGCGSGVDAKYLSKKGFDITGIDLSEGMIDLARELCPNGKFFVGDVRRMKFPNESYDNIVAAWVLHHLPRSDADQFISDLYRIVKSGGFVFLSTQEGKDDEHEDPELFMPSEKMLMNIMSEPTLQKIVQQTGFTIVQRFIRAAKPERKEEFSYNKLVLILKK